MIRKCDNPNNIDDDADFHHDEHNNNYDLANDTNNETYPNDLSCQCDSTS